MTERDTHLPNPPSDPRLDALLDEVLRPDAVEGGLPAGLTQRIMAATEHQFTRRSRPILARIGPMQWGGALAALLVFAVGAAVWFRAAEPIPAPPVPAPAPHHAVVSMAELQKDLQSLSDYGGPRDAIDQDLLALNVEVDRARTGWDSPHGLDSGSDDLDLFPQTMDAGMIF